MAKIRTNKGYPVEKAYTGVIAMSANNIVPFNLDVNALIEQIDIQFMGTLTLADYTEAPTIRKEAIENLIALVSFNGNAKQNGAQAVNFSAVDAAYLHFKSALMSSTVPTRVDVGSANGAYNFVTNFSKYFGAKRLKKIYDSTFLDTRLLQALTLNMQFRDINAMVVPGTGVAGNAALSNVQAVVHSREWQGGQVATSAPYCKETARSFDLTNYGGLDKDFLNVPIGGILTRQTYKGCVSADGVNYADPSDAFFATTARAEGAHVKTTITGAGGTLTPNDNVYPVLQAQDKAKFKLESWPTGYGEIEYSRDGTLRTCLNLTGVLSAKNQADITPVGGATNTLWIYDEQIIAN